MERRLPHQRPLRHLRRRLGSGVAEVEISIRQGTGNYWNGTAFASATEVWNDATLAAGNWSLAFPAASFPADGSYTVRVRARDTVANTETPSIRTFDFDATAPSSTTTFPADATDYNGAGWAAGCAPDGLCGTYTDATSGVAEVEVSIQQGAGSYWNGSAFASATEVWNDASLSAGDWSFAFASGDFPADGSYAVRVRAHDAAGNTESPSTRTFTFDTTAPQTTIDTSPSDPTASTSASFDFSSSEGGSTFECRIDGGAWGACTSPQSYTSLTDGSHNFQVRATDEAGNTDASPASHTWLVDTTAPSSTIAFPAAGTYSSAGWNAGCATSGLCGTYADGSGSGVAEVEVSIQQGTGNYWNGTAFASATEAWNDATVAAGNWSLGFPAASFPTDGNYTVRVRARDSVANTETPSTRTFTFDTTAPQTTIDMSPTDPTASTSASFDFSSSEGGSSFECRIDGGAWGACTSPKSYTSLTDGSHTFDVRATDPVGNTDASSASYTWLVDTTAPSSTVTFPVASATYNTAGWNSGCATSGLCGTYGDGTGAGVAEVEISIRQGSGDYWNGTAFSSGAEIWNDASLSTGNWSLAFAAGNFPADGGYTVRVRAVDAVANAQTPSSRTFTIDRDGPETSIDSNPVHPTASTSATFTFSSDEGGSTFECRIDGGAWGACTSPRNYTTLSDGSHTFDVRATDVAGNTDATPASYTWLVDTSAPSSTATFPTASDSYTAAEWDAGCPATGLCGTYTDGSGSGVAEVEISIRQGSGNYWNGTAFASATEVWNETTLAAGDWTYAFPAGSFPADSNYTIRVRARDAVGNTESPSSRTFEIDTTAPSSATGFPAASGVYNVAGWDAGCVVAGLCGTYFDATSGADEVEVSIRQGSGDYWDGSGFTSATEVWNDADLAAGDWAYDFDAADFPADGNYTVRVRARDIAGNVQAASSRTFTFDSTEPETSIDSTMPDPTNSTSASFDFSADEPGSTFECAIDSGAWVPCTSPKAYTGLADGGHTFEVRATDPAGNTDGNPAAFNWTIDTVAPATTAAFPANAGSYTTAEWDAGCPTAGLCGTYSDTGVGVVDVEVSIRRGTGDYWNGSGFASATEVWNDATFSGGDWSYDLDSADLPADGSYTVRVRARDDAGNVESPSSPTFTYDATAPGSTTSFPAAAGRYNAAGWAAGCTTEGLCGTYSDATSGVAEVEISIRRGTGNYWNGTAFSSATEVWNDTTLAAGDWAYAFDAADFPADDDYTVRVRAADVAGNVQSASSRTFAYDTTAPQTTIDSSPSDPSGSADADFEFSASEAGSDVRVQARRRLLERVHEPPQLRQPGRRKPHVRRAGDRRGGQHGCHASDLHLVDRHGRPELDHDLPGQRRELHGGRVERRLPGHAASAAPTPTAPAPASPTSRSPSARAPATTGTAPPSPAPPKSGTTPRSRPASGRSRSPPASFPADGNYTIRVRARDAVGNTETPSTRTFTFDATAPQTTIDSNPTDPTAADNASFDFSSSEGSSTFECRIDGGSWGPCTSPESYTSLSDGSHTFEVRATDTAGNTDASPASYTWLVDTTAPSSTIAFPTTAATYSSAGWNAGCPTSGLCGTYADGSGSGVGEVEVSIRQGTGDYWNGTAFASATETWNDASLSAGNWSLAFPAGASPPTGATPCACAPSTRSPTRRLRRAGHSRSTAPRPRRRSTPTRPTRRPPTTRTSTSARARADPPSSAASTAAPGAPAPARRATPSLSDGSHTFDVRATDTAGNTDATTASFTWLVDTTAPNSTLAFPAAPESYTTAEWDAGCPTAGLCGTYGDGPGSGVAEVEVSIRQGSGDYWNGTAFASATEVWNDATLAAGDWAYEFDAADFPADGNYTVRVRARDTVGNTETPSSRTFELDATAPSSAVAFPAASGLYNVASWDAGCAVAGLCGTYFDGTSGVAQVELSIRHEGGDYWDGSAFASATEVWIDADLAAGTWSYAFAASNLPVNANYDVRVRARDVAGNVEGASSLTFTYDASEPETSIDSSMPDPTSSTSASFDFSADEAGSTFECAIDGGAWVPCTSPKAYTGLADGGHMFEVRATDAAGNTDGNPAAFNWTVDTVAPSSSAAFPADAGSYTAAEWNAGCPASGLCGTYSDTGVGVVDVEVSIRRGAGDYWDGSGFTSATEVWNDTTFSGGDWSYELDSADFPADGDYTVRLRARDDAGNTEATSSRTFTYDATAPSSTTGFPAAAGRYNASGWDAGCTAAGLCGTYSDGTSGVAEVEISVRQGSGDYWNGTAFASATEVWNEADLAAGDWAYDSRLRPTCPPTAATPSACAPGTWPATLKPPPAGPSTTTRARRRRRSTRAPRTRAAPPTPTSSSRQARAAPPSSAASTAAPGAPAPARGATPALRTAAIPSTCAQPTWPATPTAPPLRTPGSSTPQRPARPSPSPPPRANTTPPPGTAAAPPAASVAPTATAQAPASPRSRSPSATVPATTGTAPPSPAAPKSGTTPLSTPATGPTTSTPPTSPPTAATPSVSAPATRSATRRPPPPAPSRTTRPTRARPSPSRRRVASTPRPAGTRAAPPSVSADRSPTAARASPRSRSASAASPTASTGTATPSTRPASRTSRPRSAAAPGRTRSRRPASRPTASTPFTSGRRTTRATPKQARPGRSGSTAPIPAQPSPSRPRARAIRAPAGTPAARPPASAGRTPTPAPASRRSRSA